MQYFLDIVALVEFTNISVSTPAHDNFGQHAGKCSLIAEHIQYESIEFVGCYIMDLVIKTQTDRYDVGRCQVVIHRHCHIFLFDLLLVIYQT